MAPNFEYLDQVFSEMYQQTPSDRPQSIEVVKQLLIHHGNEFVTHQKLSESRKVVIPQSDLDDPLIDELATNH